jgi:phosphoglucosamine mutase
VQADVGIALDGDGDRLVMVDHLGRLVDGDQLLYVIALDRHREGELRGPVVGTVMSNLGLELALRGEGIEFMRAGGRSLRARAAEGDGGVLGRRDLGAPAVPRPDHDRRRAGQRPCRCWRS